MSVKMAIIDSGNIGTDLLIKVLQTSSTLEVGSFVGIDPESEGLQLAHRRPLHRACGRAGCKDADPNACASQRVAWRIEFDGRGAAWDDTRGWFAGWDGRRFGRCAARSVYRTGERDGNSVRLQSIPFVNAAKESIRPLQAKPARLDRETLSLSYAGVSCFLWHSKRRMVGGQEGMIVDVTLDLVKARERLRDSEVAGSAVSAAI